MQIIDKIVLIQLNISSWGGRKKLESYEIGYEPEEFISLGNKRLIPKKYLNPFEAIKKRVERTLASYGVRIMGGYAIPEESADEVREKLEGYRKEYEDAVAEFVYHFREYVREQAQAYPDWEDRLERAADEVHPKLSRKFRFGFTAYKLRPPVEEDGEDELNNHFVSDEDVQLQSEDEISREAAEALVSVSGREELKQTALRPLKRIKQKITNLTPINRELFGECIVLIDVVLGEMPRQGPIQGKERLLVCAILYVLWKLGEYRDIVGSLDPESLLEETGFDKGLSDPSQSVADSEDNASGQEAEEEAAETEEDFAWF